MHVDREFSPTDRYEFDFGECSHKLGFAQIDTDQDAAYFGQWANPTTLQIVCYADGDITRMTADNAAEFRAEIVSMRDWHIRNEETFAIDGMCNNAIIAAFQGLFLGDLLH